MIVGGLVVALNLGPLPANARTVVSVGIGVPYGPAPYPYYGPPPYAYAPPAYYYAAPPPVYVAPTPTYLVPPQPAPVVQSAPPANVWYYCEDPKGYYPYVPNCNSGWRTVQPTPPAQ
jgi:hypothetical protein